MARTFIDLQPDDLADHHLCCALGSKAHVEGVTRKKAWLAERMAEGLVFRKLDVRGKVFIEFAPGEVAWRPVVAPRWLVVHCLWVSGRYAGQGHGRALVESALDDARADGRAGLAIVAADRKRPFLADPRFLRHLGFSVVDRVGPWRLFARRVSPDGPEPRFASGVAAGAAPADETGPFVARFDDQCPFNSHWAHEVVASLEALGCPARAEHTATREQAQAARSPLGTYGLEQAGALVCHHLTTGAATERMLARC